MGKFQRGNPISVVCTFDGVPAEVFFSYTMPGEARAVVDPGSRRKGTRIEPLDDAGLMYRYVIDTRGFRGGKLIWHMWSEEGWVESEFGDEEIEERPPQLL
jgi:hypothetical protein